MKKCSNCELVKSFNEFYQRKTGQRTGQYYEKCKECYKSRGRIYYHQNRKKQLELANIRRDKYLKARRNILADLKNKPCVDCGVSYPFWIMDFDHRDSNSKIDSISKLAFRNFVKIETLFKEIEKCDLVCSNCHRQRTYSRILNK